MIQVVWSTKAVRQLKKIADKQVHKQIVQKVEMLQNLQDLTANIKRLRGHQHRFRLRLGKYRILFNIKYESHLLEIAEVKRRNEQTY